MYELWPDMRVEQLKRLWEAGLSASQIAAELGNVTRNAVIGKVHRLGLTGRPKNPLAAPRPRKPRPPRPAIKVTRPVSRVTVALVQVSGVIPEQTDQYVVPTAQRVSLLDLTEATCRWPIGDPTCREFAFCGGKAFAGLPYCAHHSRIAYQPAGERHRPPSDRTPERKQPSR